MALSEIVNAVQSIGFPMALVCVLGFIVYRMGVKMLEQQEKNMERVQARCKEREDALMGEIKENRAINSKAIETIAIYSAKLDNIQSDIKDIKQDVTLLMTGGSRQ